VRYIVRQAVSHIDHFAGGDTVDWLVVAEITVVLVFRAFPGCAHAVDRSILHPVNRIALRQPGMPVVDKHGSTMGRVLAVVDGIPGDPFATERRRNNDRIFARNNQRRKHDGVSFTFVVKYVERMLDRAISLAAAFFFVELVVAPLWAVPMDIAPKYAGSASGMMNFGFGLAGIVSPFVFGYLIDRTGSWTLPFSGSIFLLLLGTSLAFRMHPDRPFELAVAAPVTA
jgi:hypothetical protein